MTNPEILDLAEKFPELNGVSFETIIGYTSAILQAASAAPAAEPVAFIHQHGEFIHFSGAHVAARTWITHSRLVKGRYYEGCHDLVETPLYAAPVSSAQPAGVPEGHKVVPIEPTPEMVQAYLSAVGRHIPYAASDPAIVSGYIAMLDAAPSLPDEKGAE